MKSSFCAFITVRTNSSRLPSKCLLNFGDVNVLTHLIRRAKKFKINPIVCTTNNKVDDIIEKISKDEKVDIFRGSEKNKLKRWYDCAKHFKIKYFHTIDGDDLFFCRKNIFKSMQLLKKNKLDIVYPSKLSVNGFGTEGNSIRYEFIQRLMINFNKNSIDSEVIKKFIKKIKNVKYMYLPDSKPIIKNARLTLDYFEDYIFLYAVKALLGSYASRRQIEILLKKNKNLKDINFFRNKYYRKRLEQLS